MNVMVQSEIRLFELRWTKFYLLFKIPNLVSKSFHPTLKCGSNVKAYPRGAPYGASLY
jgi:hypothetical protein